MPRKRKLDDVALKIAIDSSLTMREAAKKAGLTFATFKRYAVELGLYRQNQGGRGTVRSKMIPEAILVYDRRGQGKREKHIYLERCLLAIGRKYECEVCHNQGQWCGNQLTLQIDHINGDPVDNRPDNLRFLCPNCHWQTPTHSPKCRRGENKADS